MPARMIHEFRLLRRGLWRLSHDKFTYDPNPCPEHYVEKKLSKAKVTALTAARKELFPKK